MIALLAAAALASSALGGIVEEDSEPLAIVDVSSFVSEVARSKTPVVLFFFNKMCWGCKHAAPAFFFANGMCPQCEGEAPVLEEIAAEYADRVKFRAIHVNFDGKPEWFARWPGLKQKVDSVPSFGFVRNGREIHHIQAELHGPKNEANRAGIRCLIDVALLDIKPADSPSCPR